MKDVIIYFTEYMYEEYMRGNLAIGFTRDQLNTLKKLEKIGIYCGLDDDPLSHMTKVRPHEIRRSLPLFSVCVSKRRRRLTHENPLWNVATVKPREQVSVVEGVE